MTDYQQRIADLRNQITPDTDRDDLIGLHNRLLSIAPRIRVAVRWGNFTRYGIKIKEPDAIALAGGRIQATAGGIGRYRIKIGVEPWGVICDLLQWHPKPLGLWETLDDPETQARIWDWLRKHHPAAEVLLELDQRLLGMRSKTGLNSQSAKTGYSG